MQEFRLALEDLGISLTQDQFDHLVAETDDGSGETDIDEFTHCTAKLKLPIGRVARMKLRLRVSLGLTTLWLVLGVLVFSSLEGGHRAWPTQRIYTRVSTRTKTREASISHLRSVTQNM